MTTKNALELALKTMVDFQAVLFDHGHTFWHCDAHDTNDKGEYMPFRYYQTNRTVDMSTCSTCQTLMELRKQIRQMEKLLNLPLTPYHTRILNEKATKRMHVSNSSIFNPNAAYIGATH